MASEFIEKKKIGEILIEMGSLTPEQLENALLEQEESKELIGQILISQRIISELDLTKALAVQFNVKFSNLDGFVIDDEAMKLLPENLIKMYGIIPLALDEDGRITIICHDPTNISMFDSINVVTSYEVDYILAPRSRIEEILKDFFQEEHIEGTQQEEKSKDISEKGMDEILEDVNLEVVTDGDEEDGADSDFLAKSAEAAPIIQLVNKIILNAISKRTSDIHIECYEKFVQVRYRIDGTLYDEMPIAKKAQNAIISRIKIMAELNIAERRIPQDGAFSIKLGKSKIDFRISILPCIWGENIVIRILSKEAVDLNLNTLGFNEFQLKMFMRNIEKPYGMILMCGPTGSGKTTTLYSALSQINTREVKIITVENPVEYQLPGIHQTQVFINKNDPERSLTFAAGLRSILRQDPDVVMIGEIRDEETAEIAVHAALTGHMVFSTVHANNSVEVVSRMATFGIPGFMITGALCLVVAQRLVKAICPNCKAVDNGVTRELLEKAGMNWEEYGNHTFYKGEGCDTCHGVGMKGRRAIYEMLEMSPEICDMVLKDATPYEIKKMAISQGTTTLYMSAIEKVVQGAAPFAECLKYAAVES